MDGSWLEGLGNGRLRWHCGRCDWTLDYTSAESIMQESVLIDIRAHRATHIVSDVGSDSCYHCHGGRADESGLCTGCKSGSVRTEAEYIPESWDHQHARRPAKVLAADAEQHAVEEAERLLAADLERAKRLWYGG